MGLERIEPIGERYIFEQDAGNSEGNSRIGEYYWYDVLEGLSNIEGKYNDGLQLIYMDPPFMTGQVFCYKQRVGKQGWENNDKGFVIEHVAYEDQWKEGKTEFFEMMREVLKKAYRLLSPEGCLYLHIDHRTSAYFRIMLDDIFGEENFLNEIIWHYQTGGRTRKRYSRKHDTILFYSKSPEYYFDLESIGKPRGKEKKNHMKQEVDEKGRIFWSIKSGGKVYRYYEDTKVYPSDVWDDISHLQQRDPQRTGYDTQKPEALLERIIKASSRPGDWVGDFFAGSGTTLAVAHRLGRNFIGIDRSPFSLHVCRKRLITQMKGGLILYYGDRKIQNIEPGNIKVHIEKNADDELMISLLEYRPKGKELPEFVDDDWIDYWSVGYMEDGFYRVVKWEERSQFESLLSLSLVLSECSRVECPVIHIVDVLGNQLFYKITQYD